VLRHLICFIDAEPGEAAARRPECARAHSRRRRYGRMAQIAAMHESASGPSRHFIAAQQVGRFRGKDGVIGRAQLVDS